MCRDMYRVMPWAYPPVVGGQQGGAGTEPEPESTIPYDLSNFSVTIGDLKNASGQTRFNKAGETASGDFDLKVSGYTVLNSELAAKCSAKMEFQVVTKPIIAWYDSSGSYNSADATHYYTRVWCGDVMGGETDWRFTSPSNIPTGVWLNKKIVDKGSLKVTKLTIYGPDGAVLQEWTP